MIKLKEKKILQERYKLLEIAGSGGFSRVYLAEDLLIPQKWAVKEFSCSHLSEKDQKEVEELFKKEANILSSLNHPALPKVIDFFTENNKKYIIMEFFKGKTLEELLKSEGKGLEEQKIRKIAIKICEALNYLHSRTSPLIHRDVKPENIIITEEEEIKFIDFGIARIFNPLKKQDTLFMGTPGFASPEQFGRGQSPRSDIYSLGATLHYLLSNHNPAENPFKFSPVTVYNPDVSKEMEELIRKAVEIEPAHRFSSVKEIISVLSGKSSLKNLPSAPWPVLHPSEILLKNIPHENVRTSFIIKNMGGKGLSGNVKTSHDWIKLERENFSEEYNKINLTIDVKKLKREERQRGTIELITKFVKLTVPVEVTFRPPLIKRLPLWVLCIFLIVIPFFSLSMVERFNEVPGDILFFSGNTLTCHEVIVKVIALLVFSILISPRLFLLISGIILTFSHNLILYLIYSVPKLYSSYYTEAIIVTVIICTVFIYYFYERLSCKDKNTANIFLAAILTIPIISWLPPGYNHFFYDFSYEYIEGLIIAISINTFLISVIHENLSMRQKEGIRNFFMVSLFFPALFWIIIDRLVNPFSHLMLHKNNKAIIEIFLANILVILIYYGGKKIYYSFYSWYPKIKKCLKLSIPPNLIGEYIYAYLIGKIWAIGGVYYYLISVVPIYEFYPPKGLNSLICSVFIIPVILNNISYGKFAITGSIILSIIFYHYLKKYKYGRICIYIFTVLILLGGLCSMDIAHTITYSMRSPHYFISDYPVPKYPFYEPTPYPIPGQWPQYTPGEGIKLK